jgi:hypothetical protein
MQEFIARILADFWGTMAEMSPYLLFGFFVAGLLSVFLPTSFIQKHLGGPGPGPVLKASLLGIPLPLCSCGVIPVAMSLRKHGASKGATVSFLLSTPQTGVDSFLVTFSLLGPVFAIFRPIIAFVTGLVGGTATELLAAAPERHLQSRHAGTPSSQTQCTDPCCALKGPHKLLAALKYGFVTLPRDIAAAMLVGLVVAAAISALVPKDFFAEKLGTGIGAMLVMMAVGIPVYVCATASVPVAAALIAKGLTPGAAMVFLMTGPATNAAAFATVWKVLGRRTAIIYVLTVAACALGAGVLLDFIGVGLRLPVVSHCGWMLPEYVKHISAGVLLGVLAYGLSGRLVDSR